MATQSTQNFAPSSEFAARLREYLRKILTQTGQDPAMADRLLSGQGGSQREGGGGGQQQGGTDWGKIAQKVGKKAFEYGKDYVMGSDLAASEAANAAWNAPAMEASNAAWNAGAMAAADQAAVDAAMAGMISGGMPAGMTALGAGAYALPAGTAVPAGFTAVGSGVNGGLIVASNSSLGAGAAGAGAGAGGTAATTTGAATGASTSSTLAAAAPWLAAAAIAYMSYQTYKGRKKMKDEYGTRLTDEEMGETAPYTSAWLANKLPGGSIGRDLNPLFQLDKAIWGSTKSEGQLYRDRVRNFMKKHGMIGDDYALQLAQGGTFDFGKDGGARLKNLTGEGERRYSELDPTRKDLANVTALMNPLAHVLSLSTGHKDQDTINSIAGYLTNAASQGTHSQEDMFKNASDWARKLGINQSNYNQTVDMLKERELLNDAQTEAVLRANLGMIAGDEEGKADTSAARLKAYLESVARTQANATA